MRCAAPGLLALVALVTLGASASGCGKSAASSPANEEEELFHNACARCHGPDGTGGPPDSLGNPGPRNFTDPAFQHAKTDAQLRLAIENGNRGMPAFGAVLTPRQVDRMIAHVRKFGPTVATSPAASGPAASASTGAR